MLHVPHFKFCLQVEQIDVYLLLLGFLHFTSYNLHFSPIYIQEDHNGPAEVWGCTTMEKMHDSPTHVHTDINTLIHLLPWGSAGC